MSIAEDLRRPFEVSAKRDALARLQRRAPAEAHTPIVQVASGRAKPEGRPSEAASPTFSGPADSLTMLDRASKNIVFILERYRQLEEHVRQLEAWSKAQIQAAEASATRWQETAAEAERKVQDLQRSHDGLHQRIEAAERNLERDKGALAAVQERIIAAFGIGSEAHEAMAAMELG